MDYKAPSNVPRNSSSKYEKYIHAFVSIPPGEILHIKQDEEKLELKGILNALRQYCIKTKRVITVKTLRDDDKVILEAFISDQVCFPTM